MRVFVTGGTGLVGRRLVRTLTGRGDTAVVLSRRADAARATFGAACEVVAGDPNLPGAWMEAVAACDAVVHLAGESIFARRWNAEFKQKLFNSRVISTRVVAEALRRHPARADGTPKALVNASAIGYYGPHGDEELTEDSPPGTDFMADICVKWEQAAREVEPAGVRCALVRVGIVLDPEGGALAEMLKPFRWGLGGPIAGGRQYMSWVHHEDMTGILLTALDHPEARGPINGTAPNPVTNRAFAKALGRALNKPAVMPAPKFALYAALGEVAQVLASGQRVIPRRAMALGYPFKFPTADLALIDCLREPAPTPG